MTNLMLPASRVRKSKTMHPRLLTSIIFFSLFLMKIEAVTRRILRITSTDGTAKVLVFSSWNDVLDVLEHSLAANNISYVRMKGGRCDQIYRIVVFQFY